MTDLEQIPQIIDNFRQKAEYDIEEFVLDFLNIWGEVHKKAPEYSIDQALDLAKELFNSHTLPFFEKYKDTEYVELYEGWVKSFSSLMLKLGKRGSINFPLQLINYEISYHKRNLFEDYLRGLLTKEIEGNIESLFDLLVPILVNFTIPLDSIDILILKAYQLLGKDASAFYLQPTHQDFATNLNVSRRTIIRRMNVIRFLQMVQATHFLDMGALGYETSLLIHSNSFPENYKKYLLLSTDLTIGQFSIVQTPYKESRELTNLQKQLDLLVSSPMSVRFSSWNLNGISPGDEIWTKPPMFFHGDISTKIITPSPGLKFQLDPSFDTFRTLTQADIKILDFLITKGTFRSNKQLSQAIKVSSGEISQRLQEYEKENLVIKLHQFFNIGLDLSLFFFISTDNSDLPLVQHLLTLPKVDVFIQNRSKPNYYFGYFKLPNKWIKPFARKVDLIKRDHDVKFYYKIYSPVDTFKWSISLKETYF